VHAMAATGEVDGGAVRDAPRSTTRYWGGRDGCGREWRGGRGIVNGASWPRVDGAADAVATSGWRGARGRYGRTATMCRQTS
jgi:hypothetical protein